MISLEFTENSGSSLKFRFSPTKSAIYISVDKRLMHGLWNDHCGFIIVNFKRISCFIVIRCFNQNSFGKLYNFFITLDVFKLHHDKVNSTANVFAFEIREKLGYKWRWFTLLCNSDWHQTLAPKVPVGAFRRRRTMTVMILIGRCIALKPITCSNLCYIHTYICIYRYIYVCIYTLIYIHVYYACHTQITV